MKETVIYNRTSTEEQNPENQLKDCLDLINKMGIKEYEVSQEKQSAWKDDFKREVFNQIRKEIQSRKVKNLVVWDLDRIYRNRKRLVSFFELCKNYGCKIYSFRQQWLEDINKAPEPWNEMLFNNLIFILGWIAEEESNKKSERVKASMKIDQEGNKISKYGKRWGRKKINKKIIDSIIGLHKQGKSYREICNEVVYWDSSRNKKNISIGFVHKVLNSYKLKNIVN